MKTISVIKMKMIMNKEGPKLQTKDLRWMINRLKNLIKFLIAIDLNINKPIYLTL